MLRKRIDNEIGVEDGMGPRTGRDSRVRRESTTRKSINSCLGPNPFRPPKDLCGHFEYHKVVRCGRFSPSSLLKVKFGLNV
jgi:hypothetical protein